MISILVNNENLDLYEENEISFEWTSFVFSKSVREPYSTDFTIPKTDTNIRLLGLYNLQDETPLDYQEDYIKGVLIIDERPNTVNIQVISVSKDEISIFLVESNPLADFLSKNLVKKFDGDENGILIDTDDTIFPWYGNTINRFPNSFRKYFYGSPLAPTFAQLHASNIFINVFGDARRPFGVKTGEIFNNIDRSFIEKIYLVAQNKYVCPQNRKQIIRGQLNSDGKLYVYGGQHVTNDIDLEVDKDKTNFYINRHCKIRGQLSISFSSNHTFRNTPTFSIVNTDNNTTIYSRSLSEVNLYSNYCIQTDVDLAFEEGTYEFRVTQANDFHDTGVDNSLAFFWTTEVYDYVTREEDTDIELNYKYDFGRPIVYTSNGSGYKSVVTHISELPATNQVTLQYYYSSKGSNALNYKIIYFRLYSYSYFGYYCNLPEIKMRELIYNIGWMSNNKLDFSRNDTIDFMPFKVYNLKNDYEITNTEFTDEHFGKTNCFKCKNEELENIDDSDSFTINNKWLSDKIAVKESMFARLYGGANSLLKIPQYSEFEAENGNFKSKYEEVEGVCIGVLNTTNANNNFLMPIEYFVPSNVGVTYPHIPRLLLDSVKQIFKVDITCYNTLDLSKYDFLNIDGRLYYIISGTKNIENGTFNIKALLVNDTEAISFNDNGELVTWQ